MSWRLRIKHHPGLRLSGELLLITALIGSLLWMVQAEHTALHVAARWADARIAAGKAAAKDREQLIASYQAAYTWQDAAGKRTTYPVSRDSYYFLRLARNIIETGTPCPASPSTGPCRDMQVNPPDGRPMIGARSPQPWAIALVYKFLEAVGAETSVLHAGMLHNRLMLIVCGVLAYLFVRRLSPDVSHSSGLAAGVTLILLPVVIQRCFGVDDDVWILALMLGGTLATARFLSTAAAGSLPRYSLMISILATALLYATWGGWLFLLLLQCSTAVIALAVLLLRGGKWKSRNVDGVYRIILGAGAVCFIILLIFIPLWLSKGNAAREAMTGKLPPPDAFAAVAELAPVSFNQIVTGFTWPVLIAAITGLAAALRRLWLWDSKDFPAALLLVLAWFSGAAILLFTFRYQRFLILLGPPVALLAGLGISALSAMTPRPALRPVVTAGLSLLLIAGITLNAVTMVRNNRPQLNTAWVTVLDHLSQITPENAILIGWWNTGHWITYWARRTTVVDGASLRNPRIHDIGRLLATAKTGSLDKLVNQAACGGQSDCHRPVYLLTSDDLLYEFGWMISGFWQAKRAAIVDKLTAKTVPAGAPAELLAAARKIHTPLERSLFAAPSAKIWSTHWSPCRVTNDNSYNCPLNVVSKNGWLIERLIVPAGRVGEARLVLRGHADSTPRQLKPSMMRLATQDRLIDVKLDDSTNNPGVLLDIVHKRVFLGTPAMLRSLAARLVLLDGLYDHDRFERVISAVTVDGRRVSAWRVIRKQSRGPRSGVQPQDE